MELVATELRCHDTYQVHHEVLFKMLRVKCLAVSLQVIYVFFFFIFSLAARVLMGGEFFCFSYHNIKFWMCFVINKRDMNTP